MIEIIAIIAKLIALLLPFALDWKEQQPTREAEENIQDARRTLAKNDGAAFDSLAAEQSDRVRLAVQKHL